jgi:hypothetical protein
MDRQTDVPPPFLSVKKEEPSFDSKSFVVNFPTVRDRVLRERAFVVKQFSTHP